MDKTIKEKRLFRIISVLLALLVPAIACVIYLAVTGHSFSDISLLSSEWDDEILYYKQVECAVNGGIPGGYFGYNESHAAVFSFAAWSPFILLPWILWGAVFGWTMTSPFICNLVIYSICFAIFVFLTNPGLKKYICMVLMFAIFPLNARYIFSSMPEVWIWALLLVFYGLAANNLKEYKNYKTVILYIIAVQLTLTRPYFAMLFFVPMIMVIRKSNKKVLAWGGNIAGLLALMVAYFSVTKFFTAEYFTALFETDWLSKFVYEGFASGLKSLFGTIGSTLYDLMYRMLKSIKEIHADGTFFLLFGIVGVLFFVLIVSDLISCVRTRKKEADNTGRIEELGNKLFLECHYFITMVAVFFAMIVMYAITQGSKHILAFIIVGFMLLALLGNLDILRSVLLVIVCVFMFFMRWDRSTYDYKVLYKDEFIDERTEYWTDTFSKNMIFDENNTPSYDNTIIWVANDPKVSSENLPVPNSRGNDMFPQNTDWQMLYLIPERFAISCCEGDYVVNNFNTLKCRYLAVVEGGDIDRMCSESSEWTEFGREGSLVTYKR